MLQRVFMIVVIVAIILGGGYYAYKEIVPSPQDTEAEGPVYATQEVIRGDISVGVETMGSLQSTAGGSIMVPGNRNIDTTNYIVNEVFIKDGDEVNKGDLLITLDAPELLDEIKRKEEQLQTKIADLANLLNISPNEIYTVDPSAGITMHAPISGRIINLNVQEGDEINQGQTVAQVVEDSVLYLTAKVLPGEFSGIEEGQPCYLKFGQFDTAVEAKVKKVIPDIVPEKASDLIDSITIAGDRNESNYVYVYWVEIELVTEGLIRPDMIARVGFMPNNITPEKFDQYNARWIRYYAKVEGYANEERILSKADAVVTRVFVNNMQKVEKGDPVVSLAGEDARNLIREHLDTIRQYEDELRQAYSKLDHLEITSPMTGVVAYIDAEPGRSVQAGYYLGHIYNTEEMGMFVQVDDIQVLNVHQGAEVEITLPAMPGEIFYGEVTYVSAGGTDRDGIPMFYVNIELEGSPEMRPGMQANAYIKGGSAENVLLAPVEAIFEERGQYKVEVLRDDGQIELVEVELGLMDNRYVEIKSGLKEGDKVVVGSADDILKGRTVDNNSPLPTQPDDSTQEE
jgi:HlyD family secretion protein